MYWLIGAWTTRDHVVHYPGSARIEQSSVGPHNVSAVCSEICVGEPKSISLLLYTVGPWIG